MSDISKKIVSIEKLDFSEHDKVFEDKIKSLQEECAKLYKQLMETEKDYQAEIERLEGIINHKLGNWDKLGITYQEILDMKAENDLLKQHIAELESKEMEKPKTKTTIIVAKEIDGQTYVTLDDFMAVVNDLQAEIGT